MKKKTALAMALLLSSCLLVAGCGTPKDTSSPAEDAVAPEEEVIAESNEEFGEIEAENTEEETGDVVGESSVEASMEASGDALIIELAAAEDPGSSWVYAISDEDVIGLESQSYIEAVTIQEGSETEEGSDAAMGTTGTEQFIFRAKKAGSAVITLNFADAEAADMTEDAEAAEEEAAEAEAAEEPAAEEEAPAEAEAAEEPAAEEEAPAEAEAAEELQEMSAGSDVVVYVVITEDPDHEGRLILSISEEI